MRKTICVFVVAVTLFAGCGDSEHEEATPQETPITTTTVAASTTTRPAPTTTRRASTTTRPAPTTTRRATTTTRPAPTTTNPACSDAEINDAGEQTLDALEAAYLGLGAPVEAFWAAPASDYLGPLAEAMGAFNDARQTTIDHGEHWDEIADMCGENLYIGIYQRAVREYDRLIADACRWANMPAYRCP